MKGGEKPCGSVYLNILFWSSLEVFVSIGDSHYQAEHPTNTPLRVGTAQQAAVLNNNCSTEINKSRKNAFWTAHSRRWQSRWCWPLVFTSDWGWFDPHSSWTALFSLTLSLWKLFSQLHCFLPVSSDFLLHCGWLTWKNEQTQRTLDWLHAKKKKHTLKASFCLC